MRLLVGKPLQVGEDAVADAFFDRNKQRTFLDLFARDVERQIGTVENAAHEAQITRQDFRVVGDEHAFDIELDAAGAIGIEQIERTRTRNK